MKIVVFGPDKRTGVLREDSVIDISHAYAKYLSEKEGERSAAEIAAAMAPADLAQFIEGGDRALENADKAVNYLYGDAADMLGLNGEHIVFAADVVALHAPKPKGARVACAGGNFADHAAAMAERSSAGGEVRAFEGDHREHIRNTGIWGFWKVGREALAPGGDIVYPRRAKRLDYEGELAVVIGKQGKNIRPEDAKDYVWGVTLMGDWSVRLASEPGPMKFAMQKNFDTSCSLGPCIVVGELDPFEADVQTLVNGEQRQNYNTRDMVFHFGEWMEYLSSDFTLYPGDIISGGTAAGTAADSAPLLDDGTPSPETFLNPGDTVEIKNATIGTLGAKVVASDNA